MLFNSFIFILVFLPVVVAGYFLLNKVNHKAAEVYLLIASLIFYAYNSIAYLLIIVASILVNYCIAYLMRKLIRKSDKPLAGKIWLAVGILFNVGIIGYYKYWSFILWNANYIFHSDFVIKNIILPLGISFYTIQQISFLIDTWNGEQTGYSFIEYALFVSFFPQLVAGPIVYHTEFIPQLHDKSKEKVNYESLMRGIIWFVLGLSKKVLLADRLGKAVEWGYTDVTLMSSFEAMLIMFAYAFQIYFDFSGYSDMACGIGLMFGFKLPQNFNSPYKSASIRDFWKRWHMTLTRFLTKYIYFPLGGSREGNLKLVINTLIVFLVSGIWHGANYTFILWGLLHGLLLLFNRFTSVKKLNVPKAITVPINFVVVSFLWTLFRANGISQWMSFIQKLVHPDGIGITASFLDCFDSYLPWWLLFAISAVLCFFFENNYKRTIRINKVAVLLSAVLLVICLFTLNRTSIFLYFNF